MCCLLFRSSKCRNFFTKNCFENEGSKPPSCANVEKCIQNSDSESEIVFDEKQFRNSSSNCSKVLKGYCNTEKCKNFYTKGCYKLVSNSTNSCQEIENCLEETNSDQNNEVETEEQKRSKEKAEKLTTGNKTVNSSSSSSDASILNLNFICFVSYSFVLFLTRC